MEAGSGGGGKTFCIVCVITAQYCYRCCNNKRYMHSSNTQRSGNESYCKVSCCLERDCKLAHDGLLPLGRVAPNHCDGLAVVRRRNTNTCVLLLFYFCILFIKCKHRVNEIFIASCVIEFFTRPDTYRGFESNIGAWTLRASASVAIFFNSSGFIGQLNFDFPDFNLQPGYVCMSKCMCLFLFIKF